MIQRFQDDGDIETIKGAINSGAFANPYMRALLSNFGKRAFARSSACMEFEDFLRKCVTPKDKKRVCLEIGTFYGITAILLSQYFAEVVCVSVDEQPVILKHELVEFLGIKNITFLDAKDNEEKDSLVESLKYNFVYLDGNHTNDTRSDFQLVRGCGRVLFHECWPLQPPVWNLVHALPQHQVTYAAVDSFAYWDATRG